jgi:hypothetical protein
MARAWHTVSVWLSLWSFWFLSKSFAWVFFRILSSLDHRWLVSEIYSLLNSPILGLILEWIFWPHWYCKSWVKSLWDCGYGVCTRSRHIRSLLARYSVLPRALLAAFLSEGVSAVNIDRALKSVSCRPWALNFLTLAKMFRHGSQRPLRLGFEQPKWLLIICRGRETKRSLGTRAILILYIVRVGNTRS